MKFHLPFCSSMKGRNKVSVGFAEKALLVAALLVAGTHCRLQAQQPNAWQINDNSSITGVLGYLTNLTTAQVSAAMSNGWHYSLLSRILADTSSPAANGMAFGDGTRRFYIYFDLDLIRQPDRAVGEQLQCHLHADPSGAGRAKVPLARNDI